VLRELGAKPDRVTEMVERMTGTGRRLAATKLELTPRTKQVFEYGVEEAKKLNHAYIGTEHLLLGLIRQGDGVAIDALRQLGLTADRIRHETLRAIIQDKSADTSSALSPGISSTAQSPISQSAAWWCFVRNGLAPEAFVRAAADIGFPALDLVPEAYWQLVTDHGLALSAVAGHDSITAGLNRRDQHERIERELVARIASAVKWRIPNLLCFSGSRAGVSDDKGAEIAAEALRRIAPVAEAAGVTLILELLNSKVDHLDYQADHTAWGIKVRELVASPRVKLLYDIYHMQIMEGDVIRTIGSAHAHIGHYHTAGNPGRADLDLEQEINYPAVLRAIAKTGYTGYIAHEFLPKADPIQALSAVFYDCRRWLGATSP